MVLALPEWNRTHQPDDPPAARPGTDKLVLVGHHVQIIQSSTRVSPAAFCLAAAVASAAAMRPSGGRIDAAHPRGHAHGPSSAIAGGSIGTRSPRARLRVQSETSAASLGPPIVAFG